MSDVQTWKRARPRLSGVAETDVALLTGYVTAGSVLLRTTGPKQYRSCEQLGLATTIHSTCRLLRRQFLSLHAAWLYDVLTNELTLRKGLSELAFDAADICPGLVPTLAQMDQERTQLQANKEGFEIDQGLLFYALLQLPEVGPHLSDSARQPSARALGLLDSFQSVSRLDLGTVAIERRGSAAHLTINNAHCLNAEDNQLVDDIETAVDLTLLDKEIHVGVLRGGAMTHPRYRGHRVFCAGINLKALHAGQISFVDFILRREFGYMNKIVRGLLVEDEPMDGRKSTALKRTLEKPWIAAVDGFAIGGGAQMLLAFDHVIAAADSYFSLPAAHEGIVPGFSNLRLARFLGCRKSRQVILEGRRIWAYEADAHLLADEIVSPEDIDLAIERSVLQFGRPAVAANRHMLNLAEEPLDRFLQYGAEFALVQSERLYSEDVISKNFGDRRPTVPPTS